MQAIWQLCEMVLQHSKGPFLKEQSADIPDVPFRQQVRSRSVFASQLAVITVDASTEL